MLQATFFESAIYTGHPGSLHSSRFTHSSIQKVWGESPYYTEQNSSQMHGAGMGGFGIDRDIRYSIHAELPQLYESRKTHKDESAFFRYCLTLSALRVISIKFLLVISMLSKTE